MNRGQNIILIGMPACGKSTIGVLLAKRLSMPFIDTDICVQTAEAMALQEIIDRKGLDYFREAEQRHVLSINTDGAVVATGGSVVYGREAMDKLAANGIIIHLDLPLKQIKKRLTDMDTRGVVIEPSQTIDALYAQRMPIYKSFADITIACADKTHEQILAEIEKELIATV